MIGGTSGAKRFNIYKFSEVLGLRGMKKVTSKRDDIVMDAIFFYCRDLSTGVICSVLGFQLLREKESFVVTGEKIIAFAVSLCKVSYNSRI